MDNFIKDPKLDIGHYVSSLVACDVKPDIRYFLRMFPRCVTSTFTPLKAFLICYTSTANNPISNAIYRT